MAGVPDVPPLRAECRANNADWLKGHLVTARRSSMSLRDSLVRFAEVLVESTCSARKLVDQYLI